MREPQIAKLGRAFNDAMTEAAQGLAQRFTAAFAPGPCIACGLPPVAYLEGLFGTRYGLCEAHADEMRAQGKKPRRWSQEQQT